MKISGKESHHQGGQTATDQEVEKSLNLQDSLMSKVSMIPEQRRNDDD